MRAWHEFEIESDQPEEVGALLLEFGISGCSVEGASRLRCYAHFTPQELEKFLTTPLPLNARLKTHAPVPDRNWTAECEELWKPVKLGALEIVPVLDPDSLSDRSKQSAGEGSKSIRLVPGTGFGTGHHATTAMILEFLQNSHFLKHHPQNALDVGTGSGILALGIQRWFNIEVDAFDNDLTALENAQTNLSLNAASAQIRLICSTIDAIQGSYDLITANLYAEVLEQIRERLYLLLRPEGSLIISGIAERFFSQILARFSELESLELVQREVRSGWGMLCFQRLG